jgi:ABC-type lipoprotein export system ATPase subunit
LVTHDLSLTYHAGRSVYMKDGKILEDRNVE